MLRSSLYLISFFLFLSLNIQGQITKSLEGQARPLWEAGAGAVGAIVPAYPGSEDTNNFFIPFPTFFYRGDVVRADEEGGMRGRFLKKETYEINLSIGGSLPANSKDVAARQGMPDLKTMAEFGPGLLATLWKHRGDVNYKLGLNIPLRTAFTVDLWELKERGLVFNPLIYFITEGLIGDGIFTFTSLSTVFASHRFHKVFYEVEPQFATASRPAYGVDSGYISTTLSQGFSKQLFNQMNIFIGVTYTSLKGNANKQSPLFKKDYNMAAALGFVWWFYESDSKEKL